MSTASSANNVTTASAGTGAALGGVGAGLAAAALMTNPAGWAIAGAALIGAGLGMDIGGSIGSMFGGKKVAKKQREAMAQAQAIQQQREQNAAQEQSLQQIRQTRMARATSLAESAYAGIATSSLTTAALSSIGSQSTHNMQYFANDRRLFQMYKSYMEEAGRLAGEYQSIQATGQMYGQLGSSLTSVGSTMFSMGSLGSTGLQDTTGVVYKDLIGPPDPNMIGPVIAGY